MYEFKNLTAGTAPIIASSFGLKFDGVDMETFLPGFRTLGVSGRGLIGRNVTTTNAPLLDGEIFDYSSLPGRDIVVKYKLTGSSALNLREKMSRLNNKLHSNIEKKIVFNDEPDFYFMGTLAQVEQKDEETNEIVGAMTFHCSKPYKYKDNQLKGPGTSVVYDNNGISAELFATFSFTPTADATNINLNCSNGDQITIGPITANKKIDISFGPGTVEILEAGLRKMSLLKITSGVERFRILPGYAYSLSTGGTLQAVFTEARL